MSLVRGRTVAFMIGLALFSSGLSPATAHADGGLLRAWKQYEGYEVAVFTEPTPVVSGSVDISVLLLDRSTGEPIPETRVVVEVSPVGRPEKATSRLATREGATNKLLRAAVFELHDAGRYDVNISIDGPVDHSQVRFEVDVGSSWSPRAGVWPWVLWPLPVIALYGIHRRLVAREEKRYQRR